MRRSITTGLLLALLLAFGVEPVRAQSETPDDGGVAEAKASLVALFADVWEISTSSVGGAQKRHAIENRLSEHLDASTLAEAVLGPLADRFSRQEYADFAQAYQRYVVWLLVQRVADAEQPAELVKVEPLAEGEGVRALALGRDRRRLFRFERGQREGRSELWITLRKAYGDWRMTGLRIDAIDANQVFHEQFESVLGREEPAALIEELRRRNRENEGKDPFEAKER